MFISKKRVFHIGTMDANQRLKRFSFEGDTLSVSEFPEAWQQIARVKGRLWELTKPTGRFIDMLDAQAVQVLTEDARRAGLLESALRFRLYTEDAETGWESFSVYVTQELALAEAEDAMDPSEYRVEAGMLEVGTELLKQKYPLGAHLLDGPDFALTIAATVMAEEGTSPLLNGVDGLWWEERLIPSCLSAPRGAVFPRELKSWRVTNSAK